MVIFSRYGVSVDGRDDEDIIRVYWMTGGFTQADWRVRQEK